MRALGPKFHDFIENRVIDFLESGPKQGGAANKTDTPGVVCGVNLKIRNYLADKG